MNEKAPSLQRLNRTFIGSVLFIDIVGYSRGTVPEQIAMKEVFNGLLIDAVQYVAPGERIMVDTGDGAGVAFLGDPEDALFAALSLRDAIDAGTVTIGEPGFVRMGINLGPLKIVRDINGHTNMIGDAVNDAQRVMSFAEPGQVMVSHSYYDIISRFSVDYAKLFSYEGARHDKHVREHQVYSFGPHAGTEILAEKLRDRSRARNPNSIMPTPFGAPEASADIATARAAPAKTAPAGRADSAPRQAGAADKKPGAIRVGPATALIAGVALVVVAAVWYLHGGSAATGAGNAAPMPPIAAVAAPVASVAPASAFASTPASAPASPPAGAEAPTTDGHPSAASSADSKTAAAATSANAGKPVEAPKPGMVSLSITPWGEVFVDGASSGISPPLKSLKLAPGRHKIEIRNSGFAPYKTIVQVRSDADSPVHYAF